MLAKNKEQSNLTFSDVVTGDGETEGSASGGIMSLAGSTQMSFLRNNIHADSKIVPYSSPHSSFHGSGLTSPAVAHAAASVSTNADHAANAAGRNVEAHDSEVSEISATNHKVYPWQALLRKYGDSKQESYTYQEEIQKAEDAHLRESYYVRKTPADLADSIIRTSLMEELPMVEKMNNHIIIMGKTLNNLYDLIRPLRAKQLGVLRFIVILYAHDIPHAVWQRISIFEGIFVVRGSSLEEADMRRAGIFQAQKVIVLADAAGEGSAAGGGNGVVSSEAMVDAYAIFSYQCVKRMNETAQVVVEIVKQNSIRCLDLESTKASAFVHYKFTPQFASGALFTSSLLDTIVCQVCDHACIVGWGDGIYYYFHLFLWLPMLISGLLQPFDHQDSHQVDQWRRAQRLQRDRGQCWCDESETKGCGCIAKQFLVSNRHS